MARSATVVWPYRGGEQRAVIEAKVGRRSREASVVEGLAQTREGYLVLFEAREGSTRDERIFRDEREGIVIWAM